MATKKLKKSDITKTAEQEAAELEQQEAQDELQEAVNKGINLADSDEPVEHEMFCGYRDKDGVLHKTFTLREMTGRDEEAINKADVRNNPTKAVNILLSRCVLTIGTLSRKDFAQSDWMNIIKSLYSGDQDKMLMELRRISISDEIEVQHQCPNCKAKLNTVLSIDELDTRPFMGETVIKFTLQRGYKDKKGVVHKEGTMRLPNGLDREILTPLAKKNLARANTVLLTRLCKFTDGMPVDEDVMSSLTVKDREYLNTLLGENNFGYVLSVEVECDQCGEIFEGNINAVNFLQ